MGTFLKALFMASSRRLKVRGKIYDNINYLIKLEGFCQGILILLYFWGQFMIKIGSFKILEVGKESPGFDRVSRNNTSCIRNFFGSINCLGFLPKSLVELNSILLKITFGSYKFFGFFKRANYNRML